MTVLTTTASVFLYLIGVVFGANVAFAFFGLFPNGHGMVAHWWRKRRSEANVPELGQDVGLELTGPVGCSFISSQESQDVYPRTVRTSVDRQLQSQP
jgi:hypothetical protein